MKCCGPVCRLRLPSPFPLPSPSPVLFALPCLPLCPSLPLSLPLPLLMVVPSCMALAFAGALCATNCTNRVADFSSGMPSSIGIYCMSITSTSAARYVVREFYRASGQQTLPWPCVSHTHTVRSIGGAVLIHLVPDQHQVFW